MRDALPKIVTEKVPGPKSEAILKRRNLSVPRSLCGTAYPLVIDKGEGAVFRDVDGNIFLDWIGGVGVLNVGYSDPRIVEAVQKQATRYFHTIFNAIIEGKRVLGSPKEIQEVKNAVQAYDLLMELNPYKEKDLLKAHRLMMSDLVSTSGVYRKTGVGIFNGKEVIRAWYGTVSCRNL